MKVKQIFCAFIIICSCAPEPRKRADPVEIIEDGVKNFDINAVDWLKINYETACESVNITGKNRELEIAKKVSDKTGTNVIVTKGADGFIAYLVKSKENIYYTKDEYKNGTKHFVDSIGAGDSFFAGFISALISKKEVIPSLIYADVVAHLSTTQLGTIKVIDKSEADTEYKHIETTTKENGNDIYVHRSIINEKR